MHSRSLIKILTGHISDNQNAKFLHVDSDQTVGSTITSLIAIHEESYLQRSEDENIYHHPKQTKIRY